MSGAVCVDFERQKMFSIMATRCMTEYITVLYTLVGLG